MGSTFQRIPREKLKLQVSYPLSPWRRNLYYEYLLLLISLEAGIAQSVQRLDTAWTTEGSEFQSW
jgi:hypothetical protein